MKTYRVTVGQEGGSTRELLVPSKTDIQAGDAAVTQMQPGETILKIEVDEDAVGPLNVKPAGTQTHPDQIT